MPEEEPKAESPETPKDTKKEAEEEVKESSPIKSQESSSEIVKDEGNKTEVEKIINAEEEMQEGPNGSPESSKEAASKEEAKEEASSPKCEKSPMAKSKEPENPKPIKEEKAKEEVTKQSETSSSPLAVKKISSKPKVSVDEVLRSKHLNDASKFHVFKELVQEGQMSNQEVVNSILYLVRKKITTSTFLDAFFTLPAVATPQ